MQRKHISVGFGFWLLSAWFVPAISTAAEAPGFGPYRAEPAFIREPAAMPSAPASWIRVIARLAEVPNAVVGELPHRLLQWLSEAWLDRLRPTRKGTDPFFLPRTFANSV